MAVKYWVGAVNNNWNNNTGNWVDASIGGVTTTFPTILDDVLMASVVVRPITVNVNSGCKTIDFTNYGSNVLTVNATLTVAGNVKFISTMSRTTTSGTPLLSISGTSTITSNTFLWDYNLNIAGVTVTLADNCQVKNLTGSGTILGTGLTIYVSGTLSVTTLTTTPIVEMNGTGNITSSGNFTGSIKISTVGAVTIGNIIMNGNNNYLLISTPATTTVTSGTIFGIQNSSTFTITSNGVRFDSVYIYNTVTNLQLDSILYANLLLKTNASNVTTNIIGNFGFDVTNFTVLKTSGTGGTLSLKFGNTYIIRGGTFTMTGTSVGTKPILISSDATNRVVLNLLEGAVSNINWASGTRIDSSGGNPVISTNTVKTQTINWGEAGNFFFFF